MGLHGLVDHAAIFQDVNVPADNVLVRSRQGQPRSRLNVLTSRAFQSGRDGGGGSRAPSARARSTAATARPIRPSGASFRRHHTQAGRYGVRTYAIESSLLYRIPTRRRAPTRRNARTSADWFRRALRVRGIDASKSGVAKGSPSASR